MAQGLQAPTTGFWAGAGSTGGGAGGGTVSAGGAAASGYGGAAMAAGGLLMTYAESQYQQASAIAQQTSYLVAARDTLATSQVRADLAEQYAWIQAGRTMKRAEIEAQNYTIAGNTLLKNLRVTNATARARAAANGVALDSGSIVAVQNENTRLVQNDVAVADLNALTARVLGFEDATAMVQSTEYQNFLNNFTASRQAGQYETAATTARSTGGMLANMTLARGAYTAAKAI